MLCSTVVSAIWFANYWKLFIVCAFLRKKSSHCICADRNEKITHTWLFESHNPPGLANKDAKPVLVLDSSPWLHTGAPRLAPAAAPGFPCHQPWTCCSTPLPTEGPLQVMLQEQSWGCAAEVWVSSRNSSSPQHLPTALPGAFQKQMGPALRFCPRCAFTLHSEPIKSSKNQPNSHFYMHS